MGQLIAADFQSYNASDASSIEAGPFALYAVPLGTPRSKTEPQASTFIRRCRKLKIIC
jgi:hypothetical protein